MFLIHSCHFYTFFPLNLHLFDSPLAFCMVVKVLLTNFSQIGQPNSRTFDVWVVIERLFATLERPPPHVLAVQGDLHESSPQS